MIRKIRFPEQKLHTEQQCSVRLSEYSNHAKEQINSKRKYTAYLQDFINRHRTILQQSITVRLITSESFRLYLFGLAIYLIAVFIFFVLIIFGPDVTATLILIAGLAVISVCIAGTSDS